MSLDLTAFQPALKQLYTPAKLEKLVLTKRPGLALIDKNEEFYGEFEKQPVAIANAQNHSATFLTGQGQTSSSVLRAFLVTRATTYSFCTIDNQTAKASGSDVGAFTKALEFEIDGLMNGHSNILAQYMYRSGWGDIGIIGSITGTTITLSLSASAFNFEIGMSLVFASTQSSSVLRSGTAVTVTAVNRVPGSNFGTVTISAATGSPQAGDWIFRAGDRQNSATPVQICPIGLGGWVPSYDKQPTVGGGDSFFGVDRSVDSRLYGNAINGTSMNIKDAILAGIETVEANQGDPDYVFINPVQYLALQRILGAQVQYVNVKVGDVVVVGFKGIQFVTGSSVVTVMPDTWCPSDRAFVVQSDEMLFHSLGAAPSIFDTDGLADVLRSATSDGVDCRMYSYSNFQVFQPAHFCNVTLNPNP